MTEPEPPVVINIRDAPEGWRDDPKYVYIGRFHRSKAYGTIPESKWGNPFKIGIDGKRDTAIDKFRKYLLDNKELLMSLHELDGKILVCWCKERACHGDVLRWACVRRERLINGFGK